MVSRRIARGRTRRKSFCPSPDKLVNGLPVTRIDATERGMDPLATARRVLRNHPALTFEQLSWPTDAQLDGDDGGAYRASAQLFVNDLLELKDGPVHLRAMLQIAAALLQLADGLSYCVPR